MNLNDHYFVMGTNSNNHQTNSRYPTQLYIFNISLRTPRLCRRFNLFIVVLFPCVIHENVKQFHTILGSLGHVNADT